MATPGLPARRAALAMLDAVLRRGETLDQAAAPALRHVEGEADRALARAIAAEALRWKADLDRLIDSATARRLPGDAKPRAVLALMLAQWLRLGTPPHAVIATGLPLLAGGPRRLAHGVFSTLAKRAAKLPGAPALPEAVRARWGERAAAIASGLAEPPPLDLTLREPGETGDWARRLGGVSLLPGHLRLPRGTAVESLAGYGQGAWWVQDLAAGLPARLLGPGEGRRVLDLCAAPGGKALQLAAAGWRVTALDASARRIERLRENLTRTGLEAELVIADALAWQPAEPFDAVLLDAPCTATGTCRRHPDVLHRIGPRRITEMAELQARLLERAVACLAAGGRLVYSVCSLEPEEGEQQAARLGSSPSGGGGPAKLVEGHDDASRDAGAYSLARVPLHHPSGGPPPRAGEELALKPLPVRPGELPSGLAPAPEGWLRTDPGMLAEAGGLDGFFIARWIRSGAQMAESKQTSS